MEEQNTLTNQEVGELIAGYELSLTTKDTMLAENNATIASLKEQLRFADRALEFANVSMILFDEQAQGYEAVITKLQNEINQVNPATFNYYAKYTDGGRCG